MFTTEMLRMFPRKRVKAVDGMAVTADLWEEAHDYHRQLLRFHALLNHGTGIVTGLEVIASEPADNSVYILPGIALDALGQTIILPEPRAYDLGQAEGLLHLIITYNESRPQSLNGRVQEDAPLYVYAQFALEAVAQLPATPHVELARVWRRGPGTPITVAKEPSQPRANEIDLRYRQLVGYAEATPATIGVIYLKGAESSGHGEGVANLARSIRQVRQQQVWVDRGVNLASGLERYTLVYVVGRDAFTLDSDELNGLYRYWQQNGTIFYEGCRRGLSGEPPADANFAELVGSFGVHLQPLPADHSLLREPNLFSQPPDGYETRGAPTVRGGEGVVISTFDYGCMWRGERRDRPAGRSEIRNALEWGANLLAYASARKRQK